MNHEKQQVHDFWNEASCGEVLYLQGLNCAAYEAQARKRYELEPYILEFVDFETSKGKRVLEIGVGLGADHQLFALAGANLFGIDLTVRAVQHTRRRLTAFGLSSNLVLGDAEQISFPDDFFDMVYSWGVLHHTPDPPKAISEMWRVLKPGGQAKVMIYHKWSMVGFMLWVRYALLGLRPWLRLNEIYARHLESPGTKAYSIGEAWRLFHRFGEVRINTLLGHADLLDSEAGQRHRGMILSTARKVWPRWLIRRVLSRAGLAMLIEAKK